MKILVVGGGGREHAIVWKLAKDNPAAAVHACPGNGGIAAAGHVCAPVADRDVPALLGYAREIGADLTVVGPEIPLAAGIADAFAKAGLAVFGPARDAARLEASKSFSKLFMERNGIPSAAFSVHDDLAGARAALARRGMPVVVKYDGLAAGKGVAVASAREEADAFLRDIFEKRSFGAAPRVVIEDCLAGREISYLVVASGERFIPLAPAQDFKRARDGDRGPNTGGMGSYSPPAFMDPATCALIERTIVAPTLRGLAKEGMDFRGVLYCGLMLTADGPRVLEYNVRFGDPETQAILPRLESGLVELLQAAAEGSLDKAAVRWSTGRSVCVVLASGGYPGSYRTGVPVAGLDGVRDALVFHAGTRLDGRTVVTSGGRVLNVVGLGTDFASARTRAYAAADAISFDGKHCRRDIAAAA